MVSAFQFNLAALSAIALIVGLFLIYNTVAISVAARRSEIGTLQAVGAGRPTVLLLFLWEALCLSALGLILGLPAGRMLATVAVRATAETVETFYIAAVAESSARALELGAVDVALAALTAIPLALAAAAYPSWEAASVQPVEAVRGWGARPPVQRLLRTLLLSIGFAVVGWILTWGGPVAGKPIFGFLAALMLMLAGAFLTPAMLWLTCQIVRLCIAWVLPGLRVELKLAAANLLGSLGRVSVSVAALAVSLSMMVAIAVMVGSFRQTVVYWLDSTLSADLAVRPVMKTSSILESPLSPRVVEVIRQDPDVVDTVWFSSRQLPLSETCVRLAVSELAKTCRRGRLLFKSPEPNVSQLTSEGSDQVLVSESFAIRYGAGVGARIQLPTADADVSFRVAAVYFDYASNQGTVMMDVSQFLRHYAGDASGPAAQHLSIYLRSGADPAAVRSRLLREIGSSEQIYCVTNAEVRREAMRIFESTFTITYALQLIAVIVAGLGVTSTLITLIYQRQRDLGLLSLIGATGKQIRRVIVCEALVLGTVSQLIGVVVGIFLTLVLIYVINVQSFGWTIQFHLPLWFIAQSTLLVIGAAGLFGLYPAVRAATVDAIQTVREE
jgi:putative ABC transport system permease protein